MESDSNEKMLLTAGYCGLACKACSIYLASEIGGETLKKELQNLE